uniref:Uncharacterized protein n=1 Tax=Arundo donax TaxID=35708 RepID=A0A0A9CFL5_ARUDO
MPMAVPTPVSMAAMGKWNSK